MSRKRLKLKSPVNEIKKSTGPVDRRSVDLPLGAKVAPIEIDDPYEADAKILAFRSIRDDPLSRLHAHDRINDAQWRAGLHWQNAYELVEIGGSRAIDPTKEAVDGGRIAEPFNDRQRKAIAVLAIAKAVLGHERDCLVRDILAERLFINQAAARRGLIGDRAIAKLSETFKECLDLLRNCDAFWDATVRRPISIRSAIYPIS